MINALATLALIAIACWAAGSFVLRWTGILLTLTGLCAALTTPAGFTTALLGGILWLAGHALYRARHDEWRSPLPRRIAHRVVRAAHDEAPVRPLPSRGAAANDSALAHRRRMRA